GLSWLTGMPYLAWRMEHAWHHSHQGKLEARGVDMVNSPMTVEEARANPAAARTRATRIRLRTVVMLGALAVLILRKTPRDFFMFRKNYPQPPEHPERLIRSVWLSDAIHLGLHVVWAAVATPVVWAACAIPAWLGGAVVAAVLFWVQH